MVRPCGRGSSYSGKLVARAIELYLNGVKPGYIRWHELQSTLEKEFPSEFPKIADDLPSPETVMEWVRKRPDAPERLRQLRVKEVAPGQGTSGMPSCPSSLQPQMPVPIRDAGMTSADIYAIFSHLVALMVMAMMVRLSWSLARA